MALITATYSATPADFNIHSVAAGDAAEMVTKLNAAVAAAVIAGETQICDFKMGGTGAGPNWEAWFVTATDTSTAAGQLAEIEFAAAVAANPAEAVLRLNQQIAALPSTPVVVLKVEVSGGGIGTIFMAVALCEFGGP